MSRSSWLIAVIEATIVSAGVVCVDFVNRRHQNGGNVTQTIKSVDYLLSVALNLVMTGAICSAAITGEQTPMFDDGFLIHVVVTLYSFAIILHWISLYLTYSKFCDIVSLHSLADFLPKWLLLTTKPGKVVLIPITFGIIAAITFVSVSFIINDDEMTSIFIYCILVIHMTIDNIINGIYLFVLVRYVLYSGHCVNCSGLNGFKQVYNMLLYQLATILFENLIFLLLLVTLFGVTFGLQIKMDAFVQHFEYYYIVMIIYFQLWQVFRFCFEKHNYRLFEPCINCSCCQCCRIKYNDIALRAFEFASIKKKEYIDATRAKKGTDYNMDKLMTCKVAYFNPSEELERPKISNS